FQDVLEMRHVIVVAHRHEHAAGTRVHGLGVDLRAHIEIELFQAALALLGAAFIDVLAGREYDKQKYRKANAVNSCDLLGKQVSDRDHTEDERRRGQAHRDLDPAQIQIDRKLVLLIAALVAEDQHAERLQEEAPNHAKGIGFT